MTDRGVDLATFVDRIRVIVDASPDANNPLGEEGVCVYTDGDGHHCLIGEYLARHDPASLPALDSRFNQEPANIVLRDAGYPPDVVDWATRLQQVADLSAPSWGVALQWMTASEQRAASGA